MKTHPTERSIQAKSRHVQRMENALRSALMLNQFMQTASEEELIQLCLEECEALTESRIGFFHFVNQDQNTIELKAWSRKTLKHCAVPDYKGQYPVNQSGVWVDCLRQRKAVIHNDYASLPHTKGLPDGHVPIVREVVVPIFYRTRIVAIIGVGNKATDYDQTDIIQLQLLAENAWNAIQRRRSLQEREALMKQLDAVNRELQSIVHVASHDLRAPVINIDGFSRELEICCERLTELLDDPAVPNDVRQQVTALFRDDLTPSIDYIKTSTQKMQSLIQRLLRVSRIGSAAIQPTTLDMNGLIREVLATTEYRLSQMHARVVVNELPPCVGDCEQINQVFTNLIDNAIKYCDPQRPLSLRIGGHVEGPMSVYAVRDNGRGIPENALEKIFEVFFRVDPTDTSAGGEGLGLTLIHRILGRNQGRIHVESELGKGTTFTVSLPTFRHSKTASGK